jgi:hypothetical protein
MEDNILSFPRAYPPSDGTPLDERDYEALRQRYSGITLNGVRSYPFTYLIRNSGGRYEAINSAHDLVYGGADDAGGIIGTSLSAVMNACLAEGSVSIYLAPGSYTLDAAITLDQFQYIYGAGSYKQTIVTIASDIDGFIFSHAYCGIEKLGIVVTAIGYTHAAIKFEDSIHMCHWNTLRDCFIESTDYNGDGILLISTVNGVTLNKLDNNIVWKFGTCLRLNQGAGGTTGWINSNNFYFQQLYNAPYGLLMERLSTGNPQCNIFDHLTYQTGAVAVTSAVTLDGYDNSLINSQIWDVPDAETGLTINTNAVYNVVENTYFQGLLADNGSSTQYHRVKHRSAAGVTTLSEYGSMITKTSGDYITHKLFDTPKHILFGPARANSRPITVNYINGTLDATQFQIKIYYCDDGSEVAGAVDFSYFASINW